MDQIPRIMRFQKANQSPKTTDLAALPRLSRRARAELRQAGIVTMEQFAALSIAELQQIKGIKTTAAALKANAQAFVDNRPVWLATLSETRCAGGWTLDLETASLPGGDGSLWCIGWSVGQGNTQIALLAPEKDGQTLELPDGQKVICVDRPAALWEPVYASAVADDKPIYHWTGFDRHILRASAPDPIRAALDSRMTDLHHLFTHAVRLPVRSYSIKVVAAHFGFAWSGYQEWWRAETDYRRWLITGDIRLLAQACAYQRDDVLALQVVWDWLLANQPL